MPKDLVGDKVAIRFPSEHNRSLRGALAQSSRRRVSPEEWEEARNAVWAEAARDAESQDDDRNLETWAAEVMDAGKPPGAYSE